MVERLRNSNEYATIGSFAVDFTADELCREDHKNVVERIEVLFSLYRLVITTTTGFAIKIV